MRILPGLLLPALLLCVQLTLLEHEYDFAAHQAGGTCVTCLHATPLSHAMAGAVALAVPRVIIRAEFYPPAARAAAIDGVVYRARAPPRPAFA
jgi:hypothetical protein